MVATTGTPAACAPAMAPGIESRCWPCTMSMRPVADEIADHRREPPREALVLDVVADERDRRRRAAELVDVEAVEGVRDDAEAGRRAGPRPQHGDAVAVRAQPAGQLVGAPAAAARDGREGVGDEQHVTGGGHRHPALRRRRRAHRRDGRVQRPAVRRPAEVLLGAGPRGGAQPAPPVGVGQRVERGGERAGRGAVVEHARLALAPGPPRIARRRGSAGATTGRPEAMYSNTFRGDQ